MDMDFDKLLRTNGDDLAHECMEIAPIYFESVENVAHLGVLKSSAEESLKMERSVLILKANEDPTIMGSKIKPTAGNVEAFYRTDEDYISAKKKVIEITNKHAIATGLLDAIIIKKDMLANLVKLVEFGIYTPKKQK